jgi:hypothetical protein
MFFHKPCYNPNYTNPNEKIPSDICLKPQKLYKLYNAKQKNEKNIGKKILTKF